MVIEICTLESINGIPFGSHLEDLEAVLGQPDKALENYTGELELLYGECFYRLFGDRLVEATFPGTYQFNVDGVSVLSMYEWLQGCADVVDMARFRISLAHGIAFDNRNQVHASVTVFEKGRWDQLVLG